MSPAPLFSFLWSEELADVQAGLFPSCGLSLLCSWDYRGMSQHQLYWALRPVTFHCFIPKSINVGFCINTTQRDRFTPLTHAPVPIYHPTTSGKTCMYYSPSVPSHCHSYDKFMYNFSDWAVYALLSNIFGLSEGLKQCTFLGLSWFLPTSWANPIYWTGPPFSSSLSIVLSPLTYSPLFFFF